MVEAAGISFTINVAYTSPLNSSFLDNNVKNIKWYCEQCIRDDSTVLVSPTLDKINEMDKKLDLLFKIIKEQSIKIENQSKLINNLKKAQQQTSSEIEHTQKPTTRLRSSDTDGSETPKTSVKQLVETMHKNEDKHKQQTTTVPDRKQAQKQVQLQEEDKKKENPKDKEVYVKNTHAENIKTIRGKRTDTTISAAESRKWIFVSQLIKTTKEEDITNYLSDNKIDILKCDKLEIRNTEIAAFKIAVKEKTYDVMFNPELWPKNVIVRPFKPKNFWNPARIAHKD